MLNNLSTQQFGATNIPKTTGANEGAKSANGEAVGSAGSTTTTQITVRGSAPTLTTRSS